MAKTNEATVITDTEDLQKVTARSVTCVLCPILQGFSKGNWPFRNLAWPIAFWQAVILSPSKINQRQVTSARHNRRGREECTTASGMDKKPNQLETIFVLQKSIISKKIVGTERGEGVWNFSAVGYKMDTSESLNTAKRCYKQWNVWWCDKWRILFWGGDVWINFSYLATVQGTKSLNCPTLSESVAI